MSRTQSSPAGKMAFESRNAPDTTQSSKLADRIAHMSDQPSTWLRAPAPARFVRKQNKETTIRGQPNTSNHVSSVDMKIDSVSNTSATIEIDADLWSFAYNGNSTGRAHTLSTQSMYYRAHRQHVAEELTKNDILPAALEHTCDELWDGFLRELSI